MKSLYRKFGITMSLIFLTYSLCQPAESNDSKIALTIVSMCNRAGKSTEKSSGIMELRFLNHSLQTVAIPFWLPLGGFRSNLVYGKESVPLPRYELLSGTTTQLGGILISQLGYQWNDEEGHTVSKGSYDINVPNITLKPDQSDLIMVPVTCPMKNGLYELRVHFDNRILESAAATFNDKHAVFTNPSAQRYFSAEDIAKVTVKNSNW